MADTVSDIEPGASRLASSTHASGDAPPDGPGSGLLLGGLLFLPLPLPSFAWTGFCANSGAAARSVRSAHADASDTRDVSIRRPQGARPVPTTILFFRWRVAERDTPA